MDMTMGIGGIQPDMAYKNKTVEEKRAKQTESEETKGTSFSGNVLTCTSVGGTDWGAAGEQPDGRNDGGRDEQALPGHTLAANHECNRDPLDSWYYNVWLYPLL